MERQNGILMPISALPTKYGIGSFGVEAYKFVDFLEKTKQKIWQILPLVQTGFGDSPYASSCSYSFNPYFISIDLLLDEGLLFEEEVKHEINDEKYIDYGALYNRRYALLKKAFYRYDKENVEFKEFIKKGKYHDYALYMAIKEILSQAPLDRWPDKFKFRDKEILEIFSEIHAEQILFWEYLQFEAQREWFSLKKYANKKGIKILGDMPLYVSADSVDVWLNPNMFLLNDELKPVKVAGVPPDFFSEDGQLWGNPVYNYAEHKKDNFKWWVNRLTNMLKTYDYVRIDHFRGLDRFYSIDALEKTARNGEWVQVPSKELFNELNKHIDKNRIIAEDLGVVDDGLLSLMKSTGFPGMKVLLFAFDGNVNNPFLPKNIIYNSVSYTGTHDNETIIGYLSSLDEQQTEEIKKIVKNSLKLMKLKMPIETIFDMAKAIIMLSAESKAKINILPMHDLMLYDNTYRINSPGTTLNNWQIRYDEKIYEKDVASYLEKLTISSKRF